MEGTRRSWVRGTLTLAVLAALGAAALVSNAGAVAEKKEASKKYVKKQVQGVRSEITTQFDQAVSEGEMVRYSVKIDVAGADTTIATIGNFIFKANCELDGDDTIIGRVLIETSADNATYTSDDGDETDFDPADNANPEVWFGGDMNQPVGDSANYWSVGSRGSAVGPTGTTVEGQGQFFSNVSGFDCTLEGALVQTSA